MSDTPKAVLKYQGETITEAQFNELMETMNVGVLTTSQRASFLFHLAKKLGLDPFTRPFDLIPGMSGKLIIYANRAASDQLRKIHQLSIERLYAGPLRLGDKIDETVYAVEVRVKNPEGRFEDHIGCVGVEGLTGESKSNAVMKCHTKASRRGTIAFCGLGMLDETEVSSIPAVAAEVNPAEPPKPIAPKFVKPLPAAIPPAKV